MTKEDIIRMAREADFGDGIVEFIGVPKFERFAALVTAATIKDAPDYKIGYADGAAAKCKELADQIDQMPFGDTAASFAVWIREQA